MDKHLDELFDVSRQWAKMKRLSEVARAAIAFLREHFELEAGFISYERLPRKDGSDYLRVPLRWFASWGYAVSDEELHEAISKSLPFRSGLPEQQWFKREELPEVWSEINLASGILQVGIWRVRYEDYPVGLFVLGKKAEREIESQIISRCMAHINVVLEMVLARRIAEEMSIRDPLTGLFNRRGFLKEFDRVTANPEGPLTLAVLDIDSFKSINDKNGHLAGDETLVRVGDVLKTHAETYDGVCARIGGDEYLLLAHIGVKDVYSAAVRVSSWFREAGITATVSVGCAVVGPDGETFDACYHAADQRLYERKSG